MPAHEVHCQDSLRKYGKRFDELHRWMDEPWGVLGKKHRMHRHDPKTTPQEAKKLFGEYADHACLDHIMLDYPELLNSRSGKLGMDTNFCVYWKGDEKAKWCRYCEKAKHKGELCFELWKIVRRLAAQSFIFSSNRRCRAFGHRYRIESPSYERCYLKMLQGKMSRFSLPIEDFLYVTKTGRGGMNETPSKTKQNPFVDLLLEIIAANWIISDGAEIINRVRAIPSKYNPDYNAPTSEKGKSTYTSSSKLSNMPKRGEYAGTCPTCGSPLVWRKARLTGELYKGCTNWPECKYHERSYKRTPKGLKYQNSSYGNEEELFSYDDALRGPDESHFWTPPTKQKAEKRVETKSKKPSRKLSSEEVKQTRAPKKSRKHSGIKIDIFRRASGKGISESLETLKVILMLIGVVLFFGSYIIRHFYMVYTGFRHRYTTSTIILSY